MKMEIAEERRKLADDCERKGTTAYKAGDFNAAKDWCLKAFQIRFGLLWESGMAEAKDDLAVSFRNMSQLVKAEGDVERAKRLKQRSRDLLGEAGLEKAKNQNGAVCVLMEKGIEPSELPAYVNQISTATEKPTILVIDDDVPESDGVSAYGIAIDRNHIGVECILRQSKYITHIEVVNEFYIVSMHKANVGKVKEEVLARVKGL